MMYVRQTIDGCDLYRHFDAPTRQRVSARGTAWRVEPCGGGWAVRRVYVASCGGHAPMQPEAYFCCEADAEAVAKMLAEPRPLRREFCVPD